MMKWLWILGGGLMQIPAIEEAHRMGYKVIVSDRDETCPCVRIVDYFVNLDIFDITGHVQALMSKMQDESLSVDGVLCAGIDCPETAAAMQEYLGKPTAPREVARICHDKAEFRAAMRVLGYPVPEQRKVIVKPISKSGSRDTRIMQSSDGWLVEDVWHGTEHTVETLFDVHGRFRPCFITDRHFDYSGGFALEVGLRHPSVLPDYVQRKAYQIAESLGRDLGIKHGPFKLDIMVTEDGVRVIEATTRFSGGFDCQYLVPAATGKNILRAGILTCTGSHEPLSPYLRAQWNKVALSESLWPPLGRIVSIKGLAGAGRIPGVELIVFRKKVGDEVTPYIDCATRVCFIITSGNTEEEAREVMEKAKQTIKVEVA